MALLREMLYRPAHLRFPFVCTAVQIIHSYKETFACTAVNDYVNVTHKTHRGLARTNDVRVSSP